MKRITRALGAALLLAAAADGVAEDQFKLLVLAMPG